MCQNQDPSNDLLHVPSKAMPARIQAASNNSNTRFVHAPRQKACLPSGTVPHGSGDKDREALLLTSCGCHAEGLTPQLLRQTAQPRVFSQLKGERVSRVPARLGARQHNPLCKEPAHRRHACAGQGKPTANLCSLHPALSQPRLK